MVELEPTRNSELITNVALDSVFQGDVLRLESFYLGSGDVMDCPDGAVVLTQTCDIRLSKNDTIQVARLIRPEGAELERAKSGDAARYFHMPHLPHDLFVDLDHVATFSKDKLGCVPVGLRTKNDNHEIVVQIARNIGNRFSRFAFPDEVVPWFRQLQSKVKKAHHKASPLGEVCREIEELRVEADDWYQTGRKLVLHVIVSAAALPAVDYDSEPSPATLQWLQHERPLGDIAKRLKSETQASDINYLWEAFAESMAAICSDVSNSANAADVREAVCSIDAELSSSEEFSWEQMKKSVNLQLDYLSEQDS